MTKYEELKSELEKEETRIKEEFLERVTSGDYAMRYGKVGVLSVVGTYVNFYPIGLEVGITRTPTEVETRDIPNIITFGQDFQVVHQYIQKLMEDKAKRDEIPF